MSDSKIQIQAIKTDKCWFIKFVGVSAHNILINDNNLEATFASGWYKVSDEPKTVTVIRPRPNTNFRYEIKDVATLAKIDLPEVMPRDEVVTTFEDEEGDEYCAWREDLKPFESLYELKSDKQDPIKEELDFDLVVLQEIEEIPEEKFAFRAKRDRTTITITQNNLLRQEIDKIMFPDIMAPVLPCALTSEQVYGIVREYVKQNIDPKVARITSDYDFCFEVHKIIDLADPFEKVTEILKSNGKSYATPKYNKTYISSRTVKCFEMTTKQRSYNNYTPIDGIVGKNHRDLKEKVETLLNDIITTINEPLVDCPHCKGQGVVLK
jgi:hypothetical protein